MRKDTQKAKLTELEISRNKKISKKRYIVEQYFGLSHLNDGAYKARLTTIVKKTWDVLCVDRPVPCNVKHISLVWRLIYLEVVKYWLQPGFEGQYAQS